MYTCLSQGKAGIQVTIFQALLAKGVIIIELLMYHDVYAGIAMDQ